MKWFQVFFRQTWYRIDCERIEKLVSGELAFKQKKQTTKSAKAKAAA